MALNAIQGQWGDLKPTFLHSGSLQDLSHGAWLSNLGISVGTSGARCFCLDETGQGATESFLTLLGRGRARAPNSGRGNLTADLGLQPGGPAGWTRERPPGEGRCSLTSRRPRGEHAMFSQLGCTAGNLRGLNLASWYTKGRSSARSLKWLVGQLPKGFAGNRGKKVDA